MRMPQFQYERPRTLDAVLTLLATHRGNARVMAGGTDLLLQIREGVRAPAVIIGLSQVEGLDGVSFDPVDGARIGAMARIAAVEHHPAFKRFFPAVAQAAAVTATVQIRNMGTVVGNLCNASPSADLATPLLAHDARVVLASAAGTREVPLDQFFRGPRVSVVAEDEIVTEVRLPAPGPRTASSYQKTSARSRVDIAAVCVSARVDLTAGGDVDQIRVALGAVAPIPLRAREAEAILAGAERTPERVQRASVAAAAAVKPISDVRASADYRRHMVAVLTGRAINAAWSQAREEVR